MKWNRKINILYHKWKLKKITYMCILICSYIDSSQSDEEEKWRPSFRNSRQIIFLQNLNDMNDKVIRIQLSYIMVLQYFVISDLKFYENIKPFEVNELSHLYEQLCCVVQL